MSLLQTIFKHCTTDNPVACCGGFFFTVFMLFVSYYYFDKFMEGQIESENTVQVKDSANEKPQSNHESPPKENGKTSERKKQNKKSKDGEEGKSGSETDEKLAELADRRAKKREIFMAMSENQKIEEDPVMEDSGETPNKKSGKK